MCEATLITNDFEDKVSHWRKNGEILQEYDVIEKKKLCIKWPVQILLLHAFYFRANGIPFSQHLH